MADRTDATAVPSQPIGEPCLSCTIRGDWAHFRRIEGNIVKQTYRIVPRTTVAGILAAMAGIGRDSYYDRFQRSNSAVAVEPLRELRTVNMPINSLSTAGSDVQMHPSRGHARIGLVNPDRLRQQHNYEFLVDPAYRVDLWLEDEGLFSTLRRALENGTSHYVPSLGLSECLASIEYLGEFRIEDETDSGSSAVDSAVVDAIDAVEPDPGLQVRFERSPAFMERDPGGRTTTGFTDYAFSASSDPLTVTDVPTCRVDDRSVMFS